MKIRTLLKKESPLCGYINSFPEINRLAIRRKIAKELRVSEVYVRSMCNGNKKIPEKYAIPIHKITNGAVPYFVIDPNLKNIKVTITSKP